MRNSQAPHQQQRTASNHNVTPKNSKEQNKQVFYDRSAEGSQIRSQKSIDSTDGDIISRAKPNSSINITPKRTNESQRNVPQQPQNHPYQNQENVYNNKPNTANSITVRAKQIDNE